MGGLTNEYFRALFEADIESMKRISAKAAVGRRLGEVGLYTGGDNGEKWGDGVDLGAEVR